MGTIPITTPGSAKVEQLTQVYYNAMASAHDQPWCHEPFNRLSMTRSNFDGCLRITADLAAMSHSLPKFGSGALPHFPAEALYSLC